MNPSDFKKKRLEEQLTSLQSDWDLISNKLKQLKQSLIIQAGATVKFQLEEEIKIEEVRLAKVEEKSEAIEKELNSQESFPKHQELFGKDNEIEDKAKYLNSSDNQSSTNSASNNVSKILSSTNCPNTDLHQDQLVTGSPIDDSCVLIGQTNGGQVTQTPQSAETINNYNYYHSIQGEVSQKAEIEKVSISTIQSNELNIPIQKKGIKTEENSGRSSSLSQETETPSIKSNQRKIWYELKKISLVGGAITSLVIGLRLIGGFQFFELKSFDHLMKHRPRESTDDRLLIIGADKEDLITYGDGGRLSDAFLAQLLEKLKEYQPAAIGLDIFRDKPVPTNDKKGHERLNNQLRSNPDIVAVCYSSSDPKDSVAPPNISELKVGFNELLYDEFPPQQWDSTVRRYLLSRSTNPGDKESKCETDYSLALQLAGSYLEKQKITVDVANESWRFGPTTTVPLKTFSGFYHNLDASGYQIMINYRQTESPDKIARQINLREILDPSLNQKINPNWIKDHVILIGVITPSIPDDHNTP